MVEEKWINPELTNSSIGFFVHVNQIGIGFFCTESQLSIMINIDAIEKAIVTPPYQRFVFWRGVAASISANTVRESIKKF